MFKINNHWNTGQEQDILNESLFGNVNHAKHILVDSVAGPDVDNGWKKKKKTKKKDKGNAVVITKCNKLTTSKTDISSPYEKKHCPVKGTLELNKDTSDPNKDKIDKNSKPLSCKKKRKKEKTKKLNMNLQVEPDKPLNHTNDDKGISNDNDNKLDNDVGDLGDVGIVESKINKRKKKKRKKTNIEPSDDASKCNIPENKKLFNLNNNQTQENVHNTTEQGNLSFATHNDNNASLAPPSKKIKRQDTTKYNKFQKRIVDKLKGGQFRWINEKLYSCKSSDAVNMFVSDPKLFDVYHNGFHAQIQQWPENPVDVIIKYIKARGDKLVIADFGCGDAKIASSLPNEVHSFDLVAVNEYVTACDMKNVPLSDNSVDIAVFCLSLMGTNLVDFLIEAHRVIKNGGILKIAEVKSRFDDADKFNQDVSSIGFSLVKKDDSNKMFILLEFEKSKEVSSTRVSNITLNPCIYKRR